MGNWQIEEKKGKHVNEVICKQPNRQAHWQVSAARTYELGRLHISIICLYQQSGYRLPAGALAARAVIAL